MINHLSYSSISKYLKCGKQWKFRYIDGLQEESSEALQFGSAWHAMIKYELQEENKNLLDSWYAVCEEWNGVKLPSPMPEELIQLGEKMLTSPKITKTIQGLKINLESLEMETELHIPGVTVPIVGFIDMIDLDGTPVDIKTASRKWTQEQVDTDLQATFYLAALEQAGLIQLPAKFRFIVFTKTKHPDVQILETTRTHADVFALYGFVNEVWQAIQREVFIPADPSNWWCSHKYCGFWDVCEYGGKNGR